MEVSEFRLMALCFALLSPAAVAVDQPAETDSGEIVYHEESETESNCPPLGVLPWLSFHECHSWVTVST